MQVRKRVELHEGGRLRQLCVAQGLEPTSKIHVQKSMYIRRTDEHTRTEVGRIGATRQRPQGSGRWAWSHEASRASAQAAAWRVSAAGNWRHASVVLVPRVFGIATHAHKRCIEKQTQIGDRERWLSGCMRRAAVPLPVGLSIQTHCSSGMPSNVLKRATSTNVPSAENDGRGKGGAGRSDTRRGDGRAVSITSDDRVADGAQAR
jgi:hypothetical protein